MEELKKQLNTWFELTPAPSVSEVPGTGEQVITVPFNLHRPVERDFPVARYRICLRGIDPLTAEEIEEDWFSETVDATAPNGHHQRKSKPLRFYGDFHVEVSAVMQDGRIIPFSREQVLLRYEKVRPYLELTSMEKKHGFTAVSVKSNCWDYIKEQVWVKYDGCSYCLRADRVGEQKSVKYYIPTYNKVELECENSLIKIINR